MNDVDFEYHEKDKLRRVFSMYMTNNLCNTNCIDDYNRNMNVIISLRIESGKS